MQETFTWKIFEFGIFRILIIFVTGNFHNQRVGMFRAFVTIVRIVMIDFHVFPWRTWFRINHNRCIFVVTKPTLKNKRFFSIEKRKKSILQKKTPNFSRSVAVKVEIVGSAGGGDGDDCGTIIGSNFGIAEFWGDSLVIGGISNA